MDFVLVTVLFLIFGLGVVLAFQGIVGGEIRSEGVVFGRPFDTEHPGMSHPPERHPWRMVLIGLALMTSAIGLAVILLQDPARVGRPGTVSAGTGCRPGTSARYRRRP